MAPSRNSTSRRLLSNTRPSKSISKPQTTINMSSKSTRTLIRAHHNLHKRLKQAETAHDSAKISSIQSQIASLGGLDAYQQASIKGQSLSRGGDSSKVLVDWLRELGYESKSRGGLRMRMLEVGSLKVDNACARSGMFEMVRIDLRSQHAEIEQQNFLEREIPVGKERLDREGFDVVSLSLVVNYVPDAEGRGQMLRTVRSFLRRGEAAAGHDAAVPGLFLVLPAPCVTNSRYLDEERLIAMMAALGFVLLKSKITSKLVYHYYGWTANEEQEIQGFPKKELRQGKQMNNFAIVLK